MTNEEPIEAVFIFDNKKYSEMTNDEKMCFNYTLLQLYYDNITKLLLEVNTVKKND